MGLTIAFDPEGAPDPGSRWLTVTEMPGPGYGVVVGNGSYRVVRIELFNHDVFDTHAYGIPLPSTMDAGEGWASRLLMDAVGLDHLASARDGLGSLGFIDAFGLSTKAVAFEQNPGWIARYRVEVVGASRLIAPLPRRYMEPIPTAVGVSLTRYERVVIATLLKQILQPFVMLGIGQLLDRAPKLLQALVKAIVLSWDYSSANQPGSTAITVLMGALDLLLLALKTPAAAPAPVVVAVSEAVEAAAQVGGRTRLLAVLEAASGLWTVLSLVDLGVAVATLNDVFPAYHVLVDTPLLRPTVVLGPSYPLRATYSKPVDLEVDLSWLDFPEFGAGETEGAERSFRSSTQRLWANASHVNGAIVLEDVFMEVEGGRALTGITLKLQEVTDDGTPVPVDEARLSPEGWDEAAHGWQRVGIELAGPWRLFTAERVGRTYLRVTATANDGHPYPSALSVGEATIAVQVEPARVTFSTPSPVDTAVGRRLGPRIALTLPDGTRFASDERFTATVIPDHGGDYLRLTDITVVGRSRWDDAPALRRLPFDIMLTQESVPEASYPGLFFRPPGAEQVLLIEDDANTYDSMGRWITARREGHSMVTVRLLRNDESEGYDLEETSSFDVRVEPSPLTLILRSDDDPDQDNTLVLLDRMADEDIVGSFHIEVWSGTDPLYLSHETAYLEGSCFQGWLRLTRILVTDSDDTVRQLPFVLNIEMVNDAGASWDVATFTMRRQGYAPGEGFFSLRGNLDDVVRAVRHGTCQMRVTLEELPETQDPAQPMYTYPAAQEIRVLVPPPLEPELLRWTDADGDVSLSEHRELIRSSGTLRGRVKHHRRTSTSEEIWLRLDSADGTQRTIDLLDPASGVTWSGEDWTLPVSGLRVGTTAIHSFARNPIHTLENLLDGRDYSSVRGVKPRVVEITSPAGGQIRVTRDLTVRAKRTRALAVEIRDDRQGERLARSEQQSYNEREDTFNVTLPQATNTHRLTAHAFNDFGETISDVVTVEAKAPEFIEGPFIEPLGGDSHAPFDRHHYGNSTYGIRITGRVRYAISAGISGPGIVDQWWVNLNSESEWEDAFDIEMPLTPGTSPSDAPRHVFTLIAHNAFGDARQSTPTARRRGNYYQTDGGSITIGCRGTDDRDWLDVKVSFPGYEEHFRVYSEIDIGIRSTSGAINELLPITVTWRGMYASDNGPVERAQPSRVAIRCVATDPDWHLLDALVAIPVTHVEDNNGIQPVERSYGTLYSDVNLSAIAGGTYPVFFERLRG